MWQVLRLLIDCLGTMSYLLVSCRYGTSDYLSPDGSLSSGTYIILTVARGVVVAEPGTQKGQV